MLVAAPAAAQVSNGSLRATTGAMAEASSASSASSVESSANAADAESVDPSVSEEPPVDLHFRPGSGLRIQSGDRRFGLGISVRGALLYAAHVDDDASVQHGLSIRRARVTFTGNLFGENNRFKLELALSPRDRGIKDNLDDTVAHSSLLDYYLDFTHLRDINVRLGHYKLPFSRQRVVSSANLQMVDRSIANAEFNVDRDIGVEAYSGDLLGVGRLRYHAGVYMGRGRDGQGLEEAPHLLYVGRVELLPLGLFDDYDEVDFERGAPRLSLGAGYAFADEGQGNRGNRGPRPADGGTTDAHLATVDAVFMWAGFSARAEILWRNGRRHTGDAVDEDGAPVPTEAARDGWGGFVQAGYLLPMAPVELSARYGVVRSADQSSLTDGNETGFGVSWYPHGHALKLQADYFRLWDDEIEAGDHRVRVQLQAKL